MNNEGKTFKEIQRENRYPLQYAIYKGVQGKFGALRFNLRKAYMDSNRGKDEGCIFLEMAPAVGKNQYDWKNSKIIMALNVTDISKVLLFLKAPSLGVFTNQNNEQELKLYHDKDAGTKDARKNMTALSIKKPVDRNNYFFSVYQTRDGAHKTATVTVSQDEAIIIGTLFQSAIPSILAWS